MKNDRHQIPRPVFNRYFLAAIALACATSLQAHPGHAMFDRGAMHVITSPYHLGVLALTGFALFAGAHFIRRQIPRRGVQIIGTAAMVISAVLWGLRV